MNGDELRALQAPVKADYRDHPDNAVIRLRVSGNLGEGVTCRVETGRGLAEAGLHPKTGGDGTRLCSGDMLLEALVACAGVTLNAVATALGVELRDARITAEGDIDARGTLGMDRAVPVGFLSIRLTFEVDCDAPQETLDKLLQLTERYCVVLQTLRQTPATTARIVRTGA